MIPEPLKGKVRYLTTMCSCLSTEDVLAFPVKNVKSAVEWLKEYFRNSNECYGKPFTYEFIMEKIDEAFEDVMPKENTLIDPADIIPAKYQDESGLGICVECGMEGLDRKFWNERGGHCRACSMKPENEHFWKDGVEK